MKIQILAPESLATKHPVRNVVTEIDDVDLESVIEEMTPPVGGWLIGYAEDRNYHFEADNGKWKFRSVVTHKFEEAS